MDKKIIDLYDDYTNGLLDRREFIKKLAVLAGGTAAAIAFLPLIELHILRGLKEIKNFLV
jgi:carboxymethylenebutenolidase